VLLNALYVEFYDDFGVELIDVRAVPARLAWAGETPLPSGVEPGAEYLYLGHGDHVVALVSCSGSTLLLQKDDVVVEVLPGAGRIRCE